MTAKTRTRVVKAQLIATLSFVLMPLLYAGQAGAMYLNDGTVQVSPGVYDNPGDGFCVSGITTAGTMTVVPGITNFRDCAAYTTGLNGLVATDVTSRSTCPTSGAAPYNKACNVQANCTKLDGSLTWVAVLQKCFDTSACTVQGATDGDSAAHACAAPNDGAKHAYSTSLCIDASTRAGISRFNLDNTAANCQEKGGVLSDGLFGHPYGACAAYGWVYGGVKSDGTLPDISGGKGVTSAAGLGFCYTSMRMTSVPGYTAEGTGTGCPSWHNVSAKAGAEWTAGTDGVKYQSQASYDAGLGWSFASSQCLYAYGVKGYLNADTRGPDGVIATVPLCAGGTGAATLGTCVDLTGVTSQGDCLAVGGTWDNWLPVGTGVAPYATTQTVLTTPVNSTIKKLDATTSIAAGGGKFYSNTGSICTKCHTDQSRAYIERYKPGFIETGHKLAGDTAPWTTVGDAWGLKGVQCEICHATGKPTAQDLGVVIYPTKVCVGGTAAGTACIDNTPCTGGGVCTAGVPRGASGHNQTEYGTHVTGVCYTCHGTPATPESTNPASVIPVSSGDFALTSKNLAPIVNQFLNSPHAQYVGSSNKLDVITKTNYNSTFAGKICRTGTEVTDAATAANGVDVTALSTCGGTGALTCNSATNCPATPGGNRVWNPVTSKCYDMAVCTGAAAKTWDAGTGRCVETQTTCQAQSDSGYSFIWSTTGAAGILSTITTSGAGCFKPFGGGNIATTYWSGGAAHKIPNLDSDTNTACTSPTTGAGGFWTGDGEAAGTTNGVAFPATDKGNCMTCHDVHWSIESTDPEAEPFRRECTTCHVNPGTSASGAPQIDLTTINHLKTTGTPLENWLTDPDAACETCHMPKSGGAGSSPMHLWRISTDSSYVTMGATQANTTVDGSAWVDIDHACGQCHYDIAKAPLKTRAELAAVAKGMHDSAPVTYATTFTAKVTGLKVDVTAQVNCGDGVACPTFTYDWDWADGAAHGTANPDTHTYASYASKTIALTVKLGGKVVGSASRSVTPAPPTVTFTATITGLQVDVLASASCGGSCPTFTYDWNWGDATAHGSANPGTHTYATAGTKTVTLVLSEGGKVLAMTAKNVKPTTAVADLPPTASATCTWDATTWTATVVDTSTDTDTSPVQTVTVDWGDLSSRGIGGPGATLLHTYIAPPKSPATSYTLTLTAIDSALKASTPVTLTCTATVAPAYFTIGGTVFAKNGTTPLPSASVTVMKGTSAVKTVYTAAGGTFSAGSLKPGTYTLTVRKSGHTFAAPAATITVGPNSGGNSIVATGP